MIVVVIQIQILIIKSMVNPQMKSGLNHSSFIQSMERKAKLVAWAVAFENVADARRKFREDFEEEAPVPSTVHRWVKRFLLYGDINHREEGSGRPISASGDDTFSAIKPLVESDPNISTRRLSREVGVSQRSVVRCLHRKGYHPYKATLVQELSDDDHDRRLEFCQWITSRLEHQPNFHLLIVFSDEAVFHVNGSVNKHNLHYWTTDNPHVFVEKPQDRRSVTVWAMMDNTGVLSFDISFQTMNGERYCAVLKNHVIPFFQRAENKHRFYQQDGAPPHYSSAARAILDENLPNRWIGRRGPIEWPPRSPDLSTCDFFLWGTLRDSVYARRPRNTTELATYIREEITVFTRDTCQKTYDSFVRRCTVCIEQEGAQFESVI